MGNNLVIGPDGTPMLKLGLSMRFYGYHIGAWRHPGCPPGGAIDLEYYLETVRQAEAAKFDAIFFADGLAVRDIDQPAGSLSRGHQNVDLDPLTLLAALSPLTKNIGLVATASTTYNHPYHVARRVATIDHISRGRAGWNVVTSWSDAEAKNFGREVHLDKETRYERASEFVEVVTGLWDSWEPDAFLHDKEKGIFYDESKRHVLDHCGKHFRVKGPLTSASTPQGRPVIFQAGASDAGREIAAQHADCIYTNSNTLAEGQAFYADLKERTTAHGRAPQDLIIMPGITPYVGRTRDEAKAFYDQMQELIDPLVGLSILHRNFGDLSDYDLDTPLPALSKSPPSTEGMRIYQLALKHNLTIRQLYRHVAAGNGVRTIVGTAADVADDMEEWFCSGAADGFNICPVASPKTMRDFGDLVVPELRRRKLFRTEYESSTLRGNLGLKPYRNRYIH